MKQYQNEIMRRLEGINSDVRNIKNLVELGTADDEPKHIIDHDLPAYLVFLILANVKKLGEMSPDHVLVKAVRDAVVAADNHNPQQGEFDF